jgi:hypothetical protein
MRLLSGTENSQLGTRFKMNKKIKYFSMNFLILRIELSPTWKSKSKKKTFSKVSLWTIWLVKIFYFFIIFFLLLIEEENKKCQIISIQQLI